MKIGKCNGCDGTRHKWSSRELTIHFVNPDTLWEGAEQPYLIVTKSKLARDYPKDHPVWEWLREHGVRRPSPNGSRDPKYRTPEADRNDRVFSCRLSQEARDQLATLAQGCGGTVSGTLESLILTGRPPRKPAILRGP